MNHVIFAMIIYVKLAYHSTLIHALNVLPLPHQHLALAIMDIMLSQTKLLVQFVALLAYDVMVLGIILVHPATQEDIY